MCVACLRTQVDISEGIPKQVTVHFCKQCERYLQPPATWMHCALESRELLALCLKKLKSSMTKVRWNLYCNLSKIIFPYNQKDVKSINITASV
ncbi:ribosome-binding protein [Xenoophorus captivus]|uniref:60S ribosomal export protein NMD3 n=1 Tax=Xenoophorus captivus TaxID=1517983 RepID=A0ABV0S5W5_9TELE